MEPLNLQKGVALNLNKGDILNLTKDNGIYTLQKLHIGLGWQTTTDLDSIAYLKDANNVIQETVYFGNKNHKGIRLLGDNLTGSKTAADDEVIIIDLYNLPDYVKKIDICANIFAAGAKLFGVKDFKKVKNAFIRIVDDVTGDELCRYNLSEDGKGFNAFHFGCLTREYGFWQFIAVGQGLNGSVDKIAQTLNGK